MLLAKKLPPNSSDRRYARPIDGLRAMTWHRYIKLKTNNASNYQLDQMFGAGRARWAAYEKGSQPNDQLLNLVDLEVDGSRGVYLCGPDTEKLWPAICTPDLNQLKLIEACGLSADKLIADFRIRVIEDKIPLEYHSRDEYCIPKKNQNGLHPFDEEILYINCVLQDLLGFQLAQVATTILHTEIQPYQVKVDAKARTDWFDEILSNSYLTNLAQQNFREQAYSSIQMSTVKNKGTKIQPNIFKSVNDFS